VARLRAERIFSLLWRNSFSGIFIAMPGFNDSRSERIDPITPWCFPLRLCGTSPIEVVSYLRSFLGVVAIVSSQKKGSEVRNAEN
jgi:hypothetical protein